MSDQTNAQRTSIVGLALLATLLAVPLAPPTPYGLPVKRLLIVGLGLLAGAGLYLAARRERRAHLRLSPGTIGLLLLIAGAALSIPTAHVSRTAALQLPLLGAALLLHFAALSIGADTRASRRGLWVFLHVAAIVALFVLDGHRAFQVDLAAGAAVEAARSQYLSTPFFEHSYLATQVLLPALPAAFAMLILSGSTRGRLAAALVLLPLLGAVVVVLSRAGWLAAAAGVLVVLFLARRAATHEPAGRRQRMVWAAAALIVLLGLTALVARFLGAEFGELQGRLRALLDPTGAGTHYGRLLIWQDTLRLIGDSLPFGVGAGNFGNAFGAVYAGDRAIPHAHNQFLQTLVETGPIAFAGLLLVLLHPPLAALRALRRPTPELHRAALLAALAGASTTFCLVALFEAPLAFPGGLLVAALLSAAVPAVAGGAAARDIELHGGPLRRGLVFALLGVALFFAASLPPVAQAALAGWRADRARRALAAQDVAGAVAWVEAAQPLAPYSPELQHFAAEVQRRAGNDVGCLAALLRHEALAPGHPEILFEIATTRLRLGQPRLAVAPLLAALRRAPPESEAPILLLLANTCHAVQRYEEARLLYIELLRRNMQTREPVILLRLAETELNLGRTRGFIRHLLESYLASVGGRDGYARGLLDQLDAYFAAGK